MPSPAIPRPTRKVRVDTANIRKIRELASRIGGRVHSSGVIAKADKLLLLAAAADIRRACDDILQLEMLSPEQLE